MSAPFLFPLPREKSPRQTRGLPRIAPSPFSGERVCQIGRFGFWRLVMHVTFAVTFTSLCSEIAFELPQEFTG
jgi:hypothetical protein